jgi:hypothetical protein
LPNGNYRILIVLPCIKTRFVALHLNNPSYREPERHLALRFFLCTCGKCFAFIIRVLRLSKFKKLGKSASAKISSMEVRHTVQGPIPFVYPIFGRSCQH